MTMLSQLFLWIFWPLRLVIRLIYDLDIFLTDQTRRVFKTQYVISGACKKRGVCCQHIAVELSPIFWRHQWLISLIARWYRFLFRFRLKGVIESDKVAVFSCDYLKDNQCSIHRFRPMFCRRYPMPSFFTKPSVMSGCGYQIHKREFKQPTTS